METQCIMMGQMAAGINCQAEFWIGVHYVVEGATFFFQVTSSSSAKACGAFAVDYSCQMGLQL